jgi:hypothetical protein
MDDRAGTVLVPSLAQERLWFLTQIERFSEACNPPFGAERGSEYRVGSRYSIPGRHFMLQVRRTLIGKELERAGM